MNKTKEKKAKLQIIITGLILTIILFAEIYLMINFPMYYTPIIVLVVVALIAVYIFINAIMKINEEKESERNEKFENLYRSDKACYIMLKKSFDEVEERLNELQELSKIPTEEIINAQKGIAKVIINRSKENADAIINSNDQVLERLDEVEETQNTKFINISKEQSLKLTDIGTQADMKMQDLLMQLKDTELRLNQAIMSGNKVVMQAAPTYVESPVQVTPIDEEVIAEPEVEEVPPMPDLSDPNKAMSPDDIAALFANMSPSEPEVIEEPVVEEVPPMPDLSDPNKPMSPDDIAALFANMSPSEPEVVEEPKVEEKPPMPDLSDQNKPMSPEEIAALIANL